MRGKLWKRARRRTRTGELIVVERSQGKDKPTDHLQNMKGKMCKDELKQRRSQDLNMKVNEDNGEEHRELRGCRHEAEAGGP